MTDADGDSDTLEFTIEVVLPDTPPLFPPGVTIHDIILTQDLTIRPFALPAATGGNPPLSYSLSPRLPDGLSFNNSTRMLSGTPAATQSATRYTYTVTDSDSNTSASDSDTLTFRITIVEPDTAPSFPPGVTILDQWWVRGRAIAGGTLPAASGGNAPLSYTLSPLLPTGVTFYPSSRQVWGTPTATQGVTTYTYTVTDADGDTATLNFIIEVAEPDTAPSFGGGTIAAQEWMSGTAIAPVTLPVATGGNGNLTYALSPSLPAGVTFNATTWTLSGTPTAAQSATTYTYTVTDADGNTAASDTDSLTFTIAVEADTAPVFSRPVGAQEWMSGTAIAPVELPVATGGNGDLTYALSPSPPAGVTFDATTRMLSGTPTATQGATPYTYTVTDADGNTAASDTDSLTFTIAVEADTPPSFSGTVGAQGWMSGTAFAPVELPVASGGNGELTYALSPSPPAGVTFDATTRMLSGTPTATQGATPYTYTVADSDGNTAASDTATLTFTIAVAPPDTPPSFGNQTIPDQDWVKGNRIALVELPEATGGNGALTYALSPSPPAGVTFDASTQTLSGTPTATQSVTPYTYTVMDSDGNTAPSDTATLTFTITIVPPDTPPSFGTETADDLILTRNQAMAAATLPAATGGNGDLTYSLAGDLPAGVTFDASTQTLSGTPTATQSVTPYTYTVMDSDGNTAPSDTATLTFTITIVPPDTPPSFGTEMADDVILTRNQAMAAATLPAATGGNGDLTYSLTGDPAGGRDVRRYDANAVGHADGEAVGCAVHVHGDGRGRQHCPQRRRFALVHDRGGRHGVGRRVVRVVLQRAFDDDRGFVSDGDGADAEHGHDDVDIGGRLRVGFAASAGQCDVGPEPCFPAGGRGAERDGRLHVRDHGAGDGPGAQVQLAHGPRCERLVRRQDGASRDHGGGGRVAVVRRVADSRPDVGEGCRDRCPDVARCDGRRR